MSREFLCVSFESSHEKEELCYANREMDRMDYYNVISFFCHLSTRPEDLLVNFKINNVHKI